MSDKLRYTTDNIMNPHGETLLRENPEVFAEFHNPYKSEHLKSQAEAHELQLEAARKVLEQAPISPEMQSRNNIERYGNVSVVRVEEVLAQEKSYCSDPTLSSEDIVKPNYDLAG